MNGQDKDYNEWARYRDEYTMYFYGFTNSHIPYMFFDMTVCHENWPTEKLWKELCNQLIKPNKKLKKNYQQFLEEAKVWKNFM